MKAPPFAYARPQSLAETFDLLERHGEDARILAGGQSLLPALNMRLARPAVLVDINRLEGLDGITVAGGTVTVGALVRHAALERSPEIAAQLPLVHQAMPYVAHAAVRSRGTFGGSIALADPAAELPACALALDARLVLASRQGERRVEARRFFTGLYETALKPGEVLVAGEFPALRDGYRSVFLELNRRHGDYAIAGLAAHAKLESGVLSDVRLAFFGVAATPQLAPRTAAALEGRALDDRTISAAQAASGGELAIHGDLYHSAETKRHFARVLTGRALARLAGDGAP